MANKLIWGSDLYKGFKLDKNTLLGGAIDDILPFQMLTLEEKTIDWVKAVADYYEACGWNNVEKKAGKIQRNYWMRYGKLNPSDYIVNPDTNSFAREVGWFLPPESKSPLEQFYPLVPSFIDVLRGEFLKRENRWTIEAIDPFSVTEMFNEKKRQFEEVLMSMAAMEKQQALAEMGLTQESDPEQYQQEMEAAMTKLRDIELKTKNFRTTGMKWAEKVLKIHEKRYNLHELEPDAFESGLIADCEYWHIDLLDDDFKLELLNPKWCDYHKGPGVKYVSDGDYFLWFDWMSAGDVVNKFGRRMKEEDILKLKEVYVKTANIIVPDYLKSHQGAYYDLSKPWLQATDLNPAMNDHMLGKELAYNFMRSPNFDHNIEVDLLSPQAGRMISGHPQMFRVMRLYWRSMKKIGWLTKINRDGSREQPDWIDENFKVTVDPEYDTSVVKDKTKDNLIYGEHVDWTWVPEWRQVIKISANQKHTFWLNNNNITSIYIDGGPVKFQFKGRSNPFDSLPPVEGCNFSYLNTDSHSFVDRTRGLQIIYNVCMNKVPKKFLADRGNKVAIDRRIMSVNNPSNQTPTMDPVEAYEQKLAESDILDYTLSRETLDGMGQPALPQVLQLSTAAEAQLYLGIAEQIKWMAAENVGITRARMGGQKASETATGIQQGINYSETQTEKYYEQHSNLMQRVRQRMLDAAQYYTTFKDSARDVYMNDRDENVFVDIEGLDNLLPHYNIFLQSRANVRAALQTISQFLQNDNTLPIKPSAKLEAMIDSSIPSILGMIRQSEYEQEAKEREQFQQEMQVKQQQTQAMQDIEQQKIANENNQNELDRQSNERIAAMRVQASQQPDNTNAEMAQKGIDNAMKSQEMADKRQANTDNLNAKRQTDIDKMNVEREKAAMDIQKEKIKQEGALKIAEENRTAAELKAKKNKS